MGQSASSIEGYEYSKIFGILGQSLPGPPPSFPTDEELPIDISNIDYFTDFLSLKYRISDLQLECGYPR
jgi:hypothetical protein